EIETALTEHVGVSEAAVVGIPDELTGQSVIAFISLKEGYLVEANQKIEDTNLHITPEKLRRELILQVRGE
ncbi:hypothetical protein OGATHE_001761, partial [Ogataea polymorpha]